MKLRCVNCKQDFSAKEVRYRCYCGGILEVKHDLEKLKKKNLKLSFKKRLKEQPFESGV